MPFDVLPSVYAVGLILLVSVLAVALYVFYGLVESLLGGRIVERLTDESE